MAWFTSLVVELSESSASRLPKEVSLILKSGDCVKVLFVNAEMRSQAVFQVCIELGDGPSM